MHLSCSYSACAHSAFTAYCHYYIIYLSCCFQEVSKLAAQVRQLYGSNMKSVSPVDLHLTGLDTNGRVYRECVRQSLNFDKLMVRVLWSS